MKMIFCHLIGWHFRKILYGSYKPPPDVVDSVVLFYMDTPDGGGMWAIEMIPESIRRKSQIINHGFFKHRKHELRNSVETRIGSKKIPLNSFDNQEAAIPAGAKFHNTKVLVNPSQILFRIFSIFLGKSYLNT